MNRGTIAGIIIFLWMWLVNWNMSNMKSDIKELKEKIDYVSQR